MEKSYRRWAGISLVVLGALPFIVARFFYSLSASSIQGVSLASPGRGFFGLFGLPCPFCGATRAFVHLTHASGDFISYNWFWPLVFAVIFLYGFVLVFRQSPIKWEKLFFSPAIKNPAWLSAYLLALLASGWIVAVANKSVIL